MRRLLQSLIALMLLALAAPSFGSAAALSGNASVSVGVGHSYRFQNVNGELAYRAFKSGGWQPWVSLRGSSVTLPAMAGEPQAVNYGSGRIAVFARFGDGLVRWRSFDTSDPKAVWQPWTTVGGWQIQGDPTPVSISNGRIDIFARGTNNALNTITYSGGNWSGWSSFGNAIQGQPTAVSWDENHLGVFVRANDRLWQIYWNGGSWSSWEQFTDGVIAGDPVVGSWGYGHQDIFARGADGALWHKYFQNGAWSGWESLSGGILGKPSVVSWGYGHLDVFVKGTGGHLFHKYFNAGAWSGYIQMGAWQMSSDSPSATSWSSGNADVSVVGTDGALNHVYTNDGNWSNWESLGKYAPLFKSGANCQQLSWQGGSFVGLSMSQNVSGTAYDPVRKGIFDNVLRCFKTLGGNTSTSLRIQMPIDAMHRSDYLAAYTQLDALKELMRETTLDTVGNFAPRLVISVMSKDFTVCTGGTSSIGVGATTMSACQYPTTQLYRDWFGEIVTAVNQRISGAEIVYSAWNEPNHDMFTLRWAPSAGGYSGPASGAYRAGQYWAQAVSVLGDSSRVLAGEFSPSAAFYPTGVAAFKSGAGNATPPRWGTHPYPDMTNGTPGAFSDTAAHQTAVGTAELWMTEFGTRQTSGGATVSGENFGKQLRLRFAATPTRALLYHSTALDANSFDSALTDRQGRARPVLCGLANLSATTHCAGTEAFGG